MYILLEKDMLEIKRIYLNLTVINVKRQCNLFTLDRIDSKINNSNEEAHINLTQLLYRI